MKTILSALAVCGLMTLMTGINNSSIASDDMIYDATWGGQTKRQACNSARKWARLSHATRISRCDCERTPRKNHNLARWAPWTCHVSYSK